MNELLLKVVFFSYLWNFCLSAYTFTYVPLQNCTSAQYFNMASMTCESCPSNSVKSTSSGGLSCQCVTGYRISQTNAAGSVVCTACPANQVASEDGYSCVYCSATTTCPTCSSSQVTSERSIDGILSNRTCLSCTNGTQPIQGSQTCQSCTAQMADKTVRDCSCIGGVTTTGICFPASLSSTLPSKTASTKLFEIKPTSEVSGVNAVTSDYLTANAQGIVAMCDDTYKNVSSCQALANLCAINLFTKQHQTSSNKDACAYYLGYKSLRSTQAGNVDWPVNMPLLYYDSNSVKAILKDTSIKYQLISKQTIPFLAAEFSLNGTFVGYTSLTGGLLQLCKDSNTNLNAAYAAGTIYSQQCDVSVDDLFKSSKYPLRFFDIYIRYTSNNIDTLYGVPLLVTNFLNANSEKVNSDSNSDNWIFTQRLFLVDNQLAQESGITKFVRYASSIVLTIPLQDSQQDGLIYPPYFTVTYSTVTSSQLNQDQTAKVSFSVSYSASQVTFAYNLSVVMGVLSAFSALWAIFRTWSWSRRSGMTGIEIVLVLKLLAYAAGSLANIFLVVTFGVSFYYLVFYKNQSTLAVFIPNSSQESFLIIYICVAAGLKLIEVIHMIITQCTVDIFFMDWERPKGNPTASKWDEEKPAKTPEQTPGTAVVKVTNEDENRNLNSKIQKKEAEDYVSIWRTYFVCNEWNEIQTHRKTWPFVTIFSLLFFMKVVGFENVVSADTNGIVTNSPTGYRSSDSRLFRIGVIVAIFIVTGVVQWLFNLIVYERFIEDKLRNYVDLCSVSNVSVFIMAQRQFGYYIHGQNVHGIADVGLRIMSDQLQRENDDMVPRRGLEKNSDQQTFMMALPAAMRQQFDRFYAPFAVGRDIVKGLETYRVMNRFLSQFIHQGDTQNMRYTIINHGLLEDILDCEFVDSSIEGHFYRDEGNSFGNILFYGNELSLFVLDILVYCVVDIIWGNTVLDGTILWLIQWILISLRNYLGSKNLAKKTLVDDRFLI